MRKIWFLLLLVGLAFPVFADTITDFKVPSSVPLNQKITVTGLFEASDGNKSGYLCGFYFFDLNGNLIYRATDQYTTSTGRFTMNGVLLTEPTFQRDNNFNVRAECGTTSADANFYVAQKQEAFGVAGFNVYPQAVGLELAYWLNPENSLTVFFLFIIIWLVLNGL